MSYTSASKLLSSSFCGGHFLELKPKLLSVALLLSSLSLFWFVLFLTLFCSKKNAFQSIRLMTLSVFSISFLSALRYKNRSEYICVIKWPIPLF